MYPVRTNCRAKLLGLTGLRVHKRGMTCESLAVWRCPDGDEPAAERCEGDRSGLARKFDGTRRHTARIQNNLIEAAVRRAEQRGKQSPSGVGRGRRQRALDKSNRDGREVGLGRAIRQSPPRQAEVQWLRRTLRSRRQHAPVEQSAPIRAPHRRTADAASPERDSAQRLMAIDRQNIDCVQAARVGRPGQALGARGP
jgi:hypothetical protein